MDFLGVLNLLQKQFSGQLVLYVDDIAKVLGKSDKAISNLIARDALPFKVKTVGGLRCVDIFQVAQWLSSDEDLAKQSVEADAKPTPPKFISKPDKLVKPIKLTRGQEQLPSGEAPALTGKVASMLLKMRHGQATAMGRFVHGLRNVDDVVFMNEVMEKLFYAADFLSSSYVVTIKKLAPQGAKILAEETRSFFGNEESAADFLVKKLTKWRYRKGTSRSKLVEHFVLEKSGNTLFHALVCDGKLTVASDSLGIEFPGL